MTTESMENTVGQWVVERPARARVFERYGIDYCCGGKIALDTACARKNVDPEEMLQALTASDKAAGGPPAEAHATTLAGLVDEIVSLHHGYLRAELPRLSALTAKVARVHGENHPELAQVSEIFEGVKAELESHMGKEEQCLFPYCRQLEESDELPPTSFGSVLQPIGVMESEHKAVGQAVEQLHTLTNGYAPPADACNSYRAMLDGLHEFERDLHLHVHKENNILFPRTVEVERRKRAGATPAAARVTIRS